MSLHMARGLAWAWQGRISCLGVGGKFLHWARWVSNVQGKGVGRVEVAPGNKRVGGWVEIALGNRERGE